MKPRQIKADVLLGTVLVLFTLGAGGLLVRPVIEPDQTLPARLGNVVWNHERHARMKAIANCSVCHHTERQGVANPRPCSDCHKDHSNRDAMILADLYAPVESVSYSGEEGPDAMTALHSKCLGCHQAMSEGPVACRDCHAQSFSGDLGLVEWDHRTHARKMRVECVRCHHQDTEATWDGDYRSCGVCHKPAETLEMNLGTGLAQHGKTVHRQCHTCHTEYNPENDRRTCVDCHPGMRVQAKGQAPSIEQAIHGRCRECHDLESPDLRPDMPVFCDDCHKADPSLIESSGAGRVLWSHKRHAEYEEWTCDHCHHTDYVDEPHMACRSCHGTDHLGSIPAVGVAMNQRCTGCHKEKDVGLFSWSTYTTEKEKLTRFHYEDRSGAFWWDHGLHAVGLSLSCRECHHNIYRQDGVYVTAARVGKEWPAEAEKIQSCRNCHGSDGPVPGSVAEGTGAMNREAAYQRACVECHQRLGAGPITWDAFFQSDYTEDNE